MSKYLIQTEYMDSYISEEEPTKGELEAADDGILYIFNLTHHLEYEGQGKWKTIEKWDSNMYNKPNLNDND